MTALPSMPVMNHAGSTFNFESLNKRVVTLEGRVTKLEARVTPEAWKKVSALAGGFENEWVAFETVPEYRKNPFGTVELRGEIKAGVLGKSAFTLPAGYLPKEKKTFTVIASGGGGNIKVETTGKVVIENFGGEAKTFIYLDQVSFSVE